MTLIDAEVYGARGDATHLPETSSSDLPFRPIQYLGNKLRALPEILDATEALIGSHGRVADLFTGTTVVAQAFARRGYQVSAVDTQRYAVIFAKAMLGIGKGPRESCSFATLAAAGLTASNINLGDEWTPYLVSEDEAIRRGDALALEEIYSSLPLIWRTPNHALRARVEAGERRSALEESMLLTNIYAGSYFGVRQALALDELRHNVQLARSAGRITDWQYSASLTAIMSAASAAAHTAGKHFAQPLNAGSSRNERFLAARLLQDRRINIERGFAEACEAINNHANRIDCDHEAWRGPAEIYAIDGKRADLYYLDPPYTAQQYSRFYHVLETICTYDYPKLFENGHLTTGLYPTERYKSSFSSKRKAPLAFQAIINAANTSGAALVISYSQSSASSRGNARMISLEQLLDICFGEYGRSNVECIQLSHRYRQFNSASASNAKRDDPEILITCKRR
ncbi:DNA adenine methylase [Erythrobacter donghaensis]|uniref:DNA adenine methylase n=1 Tax=Erythrobacter donghaensis TaxID=267135 RepID=UPI000B172E4D|nr:DNA adenine methylase [Erythrobacter donghaensis]